MNVVLPELDGRVLFGAIAFKDALPRDDALAFTAFASRPEPDRVAMVADRIEALVRLQQTKRAKRRIAVLMPDYPAAGGRAGYAVGLDVPASVIALLADLAEAGYGIADAPRRSSELLQALDTGATAPRISLQDYRRYLAALPDEIASRIEAAWGAPEDDPDCRDGAFRFRVAAFGHVLVALPPERGRSATGARPITIQICRRATPCSLSACGCVMAPRPMRSCIWGRMARSNGCRGRPWR